MTTNRQPIGLFDSGVGGLSVAKGIRELLPHENLLYVADSANAPYGDRSSAFIGERCRSLCDFLLEQGAKVIVVACNTATVSTIAELRDRYDVPIIGVEPGVKPAAQNSRAGVIGVMATAQTLKSTSFQNLSDGQSDIRIETQACPGLVEQVEGLQLDSKETMELLQHYVQPLIDKGADTIVLGCTHYAFLGEAIQTLAGPEITVVKTELAVARQTARRLKAAKLLNADTQLGHEEFWSSGQLEQVQQQFNTLWGKDVPVQLL